MLPAGSVAPPFALTEIVTGEPIEDPWRDGEVVLAFFKTTCPVCQLAAPKVQALADSGVRVVAVGEDPPEALTRYSSGHGQHVPTLTEPAPYGVSAAFGLETVPSLVRIGEDGTVVDVVESWDREHWNRFAVAAGGDPVSDTGDGLPAFKPG
jgi:thiol-disulfide isomerase/thioredoxin